MTKPTDDNKYLRGVKTGRLDVIKAVRDILENSENRISILTILERLDYLEQDILDIFKKKGI